MTQTENQLKLELALNSETAVHRKLNFIYASFNVIPFLWNAVSFGILYIYIYISVLSDELWWHSLSVYSLVQVEFCSRKILNLSISSAMTQLLWHHFAFSDFNQLSLSHPTSL